MSYLKNSDGRIIVDAVLTDYGRQKLSNSPDLGITKFGAFDDDIDYGLFIKNRDNGQISDPTLINQAIVNLPVMESLTQNVGLPKSPLFNGNKEMSSGTPDTFVDNIIITPSDVILQGLGLYSTGTYLYKKSDKSPLQHKFSIYSNRRREGYGDCYFKVTLERVSPTYYGEQIFLGTDQSLNMTTNSDGKTSFGLNGFLVKEFVALQYPRNISKDQYDNTNTDVTDPKYTNYKYRIYAMHGAGNVIITKYPPLGITQTYRVTVESQGNYVLRPASFTFNVYGSNSSN